MEKRQRRTTVQIQQDSIQKINEQIEVHEGKIRALNAKRDAILNPPIKWEDVVDAAKAGGLEPGEVMALVNKLIKSKEKATQN